MLVDRLLAAGFVDLTVLDISARALEVARERLGAGAERVHFVCHDLLTWDPDRQYAVWHDRAVFHFLTDVADRERYVALAERAVRVGGTLLVGTFAEDGPQRCSGLPVCRYAAGALSAAFAPSFHLSAHERAEHLTPQGVAQPFTWVTLRRVEVGARPLVPVGGGPMADPIVDPDALRDQVRHKYRAVAVEPDATYHFHTGRPLAARLGYDATTVNALPDVAVESFAGVGNPFALRSLTPAERVVDVGSGAGFDSFIAGRQVGSDGRVVGVDMTDEMLAKSRSTAVLLGLSNVEFRDGYAEHLPIEDGWADAVISNGVINLCPDKRAVFGEIRRVLKPGGTLQFADIANGRPVPAEALRDIDLWTG